MRPIRTFLSCAAAAASLVLMAGCAGQPALLATTSEATTPKACLAVTGSRIAPDTRNACKPLGYPFRSYSSEDLEATGHIDLVDALRSVDPAFR